MHAVLLRFTEDRDVLREPVHLEEDLGGNRAEVEPLACMRRSVWGLRYADDAGSLLRRKALLRRRLSAL